jgi:hypothetical protein
VMESGFGHNLDNLVSSSFSSLIHPENLGPPGDYRSNDAEIRSFFLKAALSGDGNTKSITQLSPDDISIGLLFALFAENPEKVTSQNRCLEIIQTYPIFAESGYQPTTECARRLHIIHSKNFTGSSYKKFKTSWRATKNSNQLIAFLTRSIFAVSTPKHLQEEHRSNPPYCDPAETQGITERIEPEIPGVSGSAHLNSYVLSTPPAVCVKEGMCERKREKVRDKERERFKKKERSERSLSHTLSYSRHSISHSRSLISLTHRHTYSSLSLSLTWLSLSRTHLLLSLSLTLILAHYSLSFTHTHLLLSLSFTPLSVTHTLAPLSIVDSSLSLSLTLTPLSLAHLSLSLTHTPLLLSLSDSLRPSVLSLSLSYTHLLLSLCLTTSLPHSLTLTLTALSHTHTVSHTSHSPSRTRLLRE